MSVSIHPSCANGRRTHERVNTAKPHKGGGKLAKKQKALGVRRLAHSATVGSGKGINPAAFKTPGSMNQHK